MSINYYDDALYLELEICFKQIKDELNDVYDYFESKGDYDGSCLAETEKGVLSSLWEDIWQINFELKGQSDEVPYTSIQIPGPASSFYYALQKEQCISQDIKGVREQRNGFINSNMPLRLRYGEFYGYTIYNILYKNYDWIKYAFGKFNSDVYRCKRYKAVIDKYFEKAFAFYMRFENK